MSRKTLMAGSALMLGLASVAGSGVSAIETSGITSEADLKNCLTNVSAVCTLGGDISLTEAIVITGEAELNLGNYKISEGETFDNAGWGLLTVANGASLTINGETDAGLFGKTAFAAVRMTEKNTYNKDNVASLIVNGGTLSGLYYGITGNGSRHNTKITINGGIVKGNAEGDNSAIYHPQTGVLNINGGVLTGDTGVAIKSGTLNMNGGAIIATGVDTRPVAGYSNGINIAGAAIQVESNTDYAGKVVLNFNGGKVISENGVALYEYIGKGDATVVEEVNFKNAELEGDVLAYAVSSDFDAWRNRIVSGSAVKEGNKVDSKKLVVAEVTEFDGLKEGERLVIKKAEISEAEGEDLGKKATEKGIENLETDMVYDITIVDTDNNLVPNHEGEVTFVMPIEGEVEPAEGYSRNWYLFYFHEDTLNEITDFNVEDGKLTFSTDEFSTYILAHEDKLIPGSPDTGRMTSEAASTVTTILASVMAGIVVAGLSAKYLLRR